MRQEGTLDQSYGISSGRKSHLHGSPTAINSTEWPIKTERGRQPSTKFALERSIFLQTPGIKTNKDNRTGAAGYRPMFTITINNTHAIYSTLQQTATSLFYTWNLQRHKILLERFTLIFCINLKWLKLWYSAKYFQPARNTGGVQFFLQDNCVP